MPLRKPTADTMEQSMTRIQHVQHENVKDINKDLNATSNLLIIIKGKIHMPGKNCLECWRNRNVYTTLEQIIYLPTAS